MFSSTDSRVAAGFLACCLTISCTFGPALVPSAQADEKAEQGSGDFFSVPNAKDCAYDESRNRLYVTTGTQLVILDTKNKKTVDTIDLAGGPRACDISADFEVLAVAPADAHFIYYITLKDLEITQVRFDADGGETGVHGLCIGIDKSVLFSMGFAGSGGVQLRRFDPLTKKVEVVSGVQMDAVVTASGDRRYAAVADGNISSGPLNLYDFTKHKYKSVIGLGGFNYEMACARNAAYFARPQADGCQVYDKKGGRLAHFGKRPVICAAFHPKADRLYIMEDGAMSIQEFDVNRGNNTNAFAVEKPLVIEGIVHTSVVGNVVPLGPIGAQANFRRIQSVEYQTFKSGRLKVSESGKSLFAVVPTGVYMFALNVPAEALANEPKDQAAPRMKIIDGSNNKNPASLPESSEDGAKTKNGSSEPDEPIELPEKFDEFIVGGGGRFYLFYTHKSNTVHVFDVAHRKMAGKIEVAEQALISAGREKIMIVLPGQRVAQRWNLATLQQEKSAPIKVGAELEQVLMGIDSDGPLLLWEKNHGTFLDVKSMRQFLPKGPMLTGDEKSGLHLSVSANGQTFTGWVDTGSGGTFNALTLKGNRCAGAVGPGGIYGDSRCLPIADGSLFLTHDGTVYDRTFQKLSNNWLKQARLVPTEVPSHFIALRAIDGNAKVDICTAANRHVVFSCDEAFPIKDLRFIENSRIRYVARLNTLVVVPETNDSILVRRLDSFKDAIKSEDNNPSQESAGERRVWSDSTGKTLQASLIEVKDGVVQLKKSDGTVIGVPLEKLSAPDRNFIESRK